jgi:subtilisin family serine protease
MNGLRLIACGLCLALLMATLPANSEANKLSPQLRAALDSLAPDQMIDVVVHLSDRLDGSNLDAADTSLVSALRAHAGRSQASILRWLRTYQTDGRVTNVTPFWIFNGLSLSASPGVLRELSRRDDVASVTLDEITFAPNRPTSSSDAAPTGDNLLAIGAPQAWARGITGKGVVVAVLDSGVDITHPELAARWRGGSNSWFDPYNEHPEAPFDPLGHGTQTLGVILAGDASGMSLGIAPDAQWIAARVFNDRGRATVSAVHKALQWVIDPDGDPDTDDAPDVVNNSWSLVNPKCDLEYTDDLRALREAGILPVFAAGLRGSVSPANTSQAFSVGALADANTISRDSPAGPSICDESLVFPQVVAPGEDIRTTDRFGYYTTLKGTSFAAAHVSGALALLLEADATLTPDEQAAILTETAVDLGEPGADNRFGYGRIDIARALDRVLGPDPAHPSTPWQPEQPVSIDPPAPQSTHAGSALTQLALICVAVIVVVGLVIAWRGARSNR